MKRIISALALVSVAALGSAACGGDDDDTTGGSSGSAGSAGKGNAAGAPGTPDEGGGTGGTGTTPGAAGAASGGNVSCDPSKATTCQNDTDCPFVADGTARTTAQACGQGECLQSSDENCPRDCILAQLDMTSDCASCYADFVNCTIGHCLAACIADPDSDGCHECQVSSGCRPTFDSCSGLGE